MKLQYKGEHSHLPGENWNGQVSRYQPDPNPFLFLNLFFFIFVPLAVSSSCFCPCFIPPSFSSFPSLCPSLSPYCALFPSSCAAERQRKGAIGCEIHVASQSSIHLCAPIVKSHRGHTPIMKTNNTLQRLSHTSTQLHKGKMWWVIFFMCRNIKNWNDTQMCTQTRIQYMYTCCQWLAEMIKLFMQKTPEFIPQCQSNKWLVREQGSLIYYTTFMKMSEVATLIRTAPVNTLIKGKTPTFWRVSYLLKVKLMQSVNLGRVDKQTLQCPESTYMFLVNVCRSFQIRMMILRSYFVL